MCPSSRALLGAMRPLPCWFRQGNRTLSISNIGVCGSCGFRHSKVSELISSLKSTPAPTGAFGWLFRGCAPGDERKTSARARATLGFSATFSTIGPAIVQAGEATEWKRVFLSVLFAVGLLWGAWLCLWAKLRVGVGGPTDDLGLLILARSAGR